MSKKIIYAALVIVAIYLLALMKVAFREYDESMAYSPVSAYALMAVVALCLAVILRQGFRLLWQSKLTRLIFALWIICLFDAFLFGNPRTPMFKLTLVVSLWELVYLMFYIFQRTNPECVKISHMFMVGFAVIAALVFLYSNNMRSMMLAELKGREGNNLIFYILTLLPWLLLSSSKKHKTIILFIATVLCVISLKRSSQIMIICIDAFFVYQEFIKGMHNKFKAAIISLVLLCVFSLLVVYSNQLTESFAMERMSSVVEDEGNGRIEHWKDAWGLIQSEQSVFKMIFGHGYCAVEVDMNQEFHSAHNDFLEVMYDFGILSFLIFIAIHICLIKRLVYLLKTKSSYKIGFCASYIIFFGMSMVSHLVIYPSYFILLTSYWGMIEAVYTTPERKNRA